MEEQTGKESISRLSLSLCPCVRARFFTSRSLFPSLPVGDKRAADNLILAVPSKTNLRRGGKDVQETNQHRARVDDLPSADCSGKRLYRARRAEGLRPLGRPWLLGLS